MLAWSEGTDNGRQKTRNHGCDVIVGELFTDYSDHPRKLCHAVKTQSTGAGRCQLLPVGGMPTANSSADFSPKIRTLWHCSKIKGVALYL